MSQYEVWCHHCDVTFPVKTRRCLHCGGRTSPHRLQHSMQEPGLELVEEVPPFVTAVGPPREAPPREVAPPPLEDPDAFEEESGRRSLMRAGMSVVWMILLAAGYLWKSCTG